VTNVSIRSILQGGLVIPAHPLAITTAKKLDERRQRALSRYYIAAGAGGLAVGVHTTQFEIREPRHGLFRPVLELAREECDLADSGRKSPLVRIGGICGATAQAVREAELLRDLGYHVGLLSLAALGTATDEELVAHCRAVARVIPLCGFYLQPAVGGRLLSYGFWRRLGESVSDLWAVKLAPFNRYQSLDVIRGLRDAGRHDVALYTGNDDNILIDLLTPWRVGETSEQPSRIVGGLLGHWAVWTRKAVEQWERCDRAWREGQIVDADLLALASQVTDANAAVFDAANGFAGCLAGIQEVLRRQGLLEHAECLSDHERLSPGQAEALDRIYRVYPHLVDDDFVMANRETWLAG
jgi:hypothetical protein